MRSLIAWLLLILASFQWLGSYFSFKIQHDVVVMYQMNNLEYSVAEILMRETGATLQLQAVSENYLNIMGYSNSFVVFHKVHGETIPFRINQKSHSVLEYETTINLNDDQQNRDRDIALFNNILSEFVPAERNPGQTLNSFTFISSCCLYLENNINTPNLLVPTPPPQFS